MRNGSRQGAAQQGTLLLDSRVFYSNLVRKSLRTCKGLEKEGLPGEKGDKSRVGRHRHIHDPGIQQEPGWFTEGFDTADLQEAKALLEELGG